MRTIALPEWNDLPQEVRSALVNEGEYWDAFIGGDMAHALYLKLRTLLDGLNLDAPDPCQTRLDLPDP